MGEFIHIQDYTYDLPPDRIAADPLEKRDESKLLVYRKGTLEHKTFKNLAEFLPEKSLLFFNDTRVIPARIHFQKDSGADIEIFLLSPLTPSTLHATAMLAKNQSSWQCTIGNLKRWKDGQLLTKKTGDTLLTVSLLSREKGIVEFTWAGDQSFSEILTEAGTTPLPPYIKRAASPSDSNRYQTIYSHYDGAVAAPTAGLHFTEHVFESLRQKNIGWDFLTLHVSAGTFQPVKAINALEHSMHHEQVIIDKQSIDNLLLADKFIVAVGTTSLRTLESLYWYGVKLLQTPGVGFTISQHEPYTLPNSISFGDSILAVADHMNTNGLKNLAGTTSIFIYPGYRFRVCKGLITNFHQPASTLMLLVAAFIGSRWRDVYREALSNDYRFLSYGDSSLLLP
jgi:S-adenosylmethionine:tRNA ribosyltransferase-isomerase